MKRIYLTTSIPYVNGDPHIGHALELVQVDVMARAYRQLGYEVYCLTGTDENAQKNVESAEKMGISVQELVDKYSLKFKNLQTPLNLSFDQFIRTTDKKHLMGAQKLWRLCDQDIYKKTYSGLYCVGCETFYKEGDLPNNFCTNHNRQLETISEENYFFALSKYQHKIASLIQSDNLKIQPFFRKQEILNFINKGLDDISISRPDTRMKGWGIPVPEDNSQRMYVWFDALTNYISALDFGTEGELFEKFWINNPLKVHVIGKDIVKFHAIYWIAMLLSAKQFIPTSLYVHGFISVDGSKISKTIGNVIDPASLVAIYGTDALRYYLLREISPYVDGDFSYERMHQLYSSDLANELGNLLSRLTNLGEKDSIFIETDIKNEIIDLALDRAAKFEFNLGLEEIFVKVKELNRSINDFEPWSKSKIDRADFLKKSLKQLNTIGRALKPYLPESSLKIQNATENKIKKSASLFPRVNMSLKINS